MIAVAFPEHYPTLIILSFCILDFEKNYAACTHD